jgi:hypothetical protein
MSNWTTTTTRITEQTTGSGDDDLATFGEQQRLFVDRLAADNRNGVDVSVLGELGRLLLDLLRQLARGRENERVGALVRLAHADRREARDERHHRQQEGGRLARAGFGHAQHVAAGQRDRQRLHLDRRRLLVARRIDRAPQRLWQRYLVPRSVRMRYCAALQLRNACQLLAAQTMRAPRQPLSQCCDLRGKCANRARPFVRASSRSNVILATLSTPI